MGQGEDRGEDGDAGGADEKSEDSVERPVIGNMSDGIDVPGESLEDDAGHESSPNVAQGRNDSANEQVRAAETGVTMQT